MSDCPKARDGLLTEAVGDELVVFDSETNEAHALNPLASVIFSSSDGHTGADQLAAIASEKLGHSVDSEDVAEALAELAGHELLVGAKADGISRRRLLQVGSVAAAGALVTTAVAPAYASTGSGCVNSPTSLPTGFSDMAIIVSAVVGGQTVYYALKWTGTGGAGSTTFVACDSFQVGGCNNDWPPSGYTFGTFPNCPTGSTPPPGFSVVYSSPDLYITVPSPYTLVAWIAHNGTYGCTGLCTVTENSSGCTSVGYTSTCTGAY